MLFGVVLHVEIKRYSSRGKLRPFSNMVCCTCMRFRVSLIAESFEVYRPECKTELKLTPNLIKI